MTRKIKAQDVKPGMKVEFTHEGWTSSGIVYSVWTQGTQTWFYSQPNHARRYLSSNQEVTVLAEPQPDEPTEFGAAVEAGGVWFVRLDVRAFDDSDFQPWQSESLIQCTWAEVCDQGPVTIINADPFAAPAQDATEPRTWDRWEDVPEMVAVWAEVGQVVVRRASDGVERLYSDNEWGCSILTARDLNFLAPFTEVHDA